MTDRNELHTLRTIAKRFARAQRIAHNVALDFLASELGHPHWNKLAKEWHKGWRPTKGQMEHATRLESAEVREHKTDKEPEAFRVYERQGVIDGHPYEISSDILGVCISGRGWAIFVDAAPSVEPTIEIYEGVENNPADDVKFVAKAFLIANEEVQLVRERIAKDWRRRATMPDAEGRVTHPLFSGTESTEWFCLHCDGEFTGNQMAGNMWHCPSCSATPIDIFPVPFWRGDAA